MIMPTIEALVTGQPVWRRKTCGASVGVYNRTTCVDEDNLL